MNNFFKFEAVVLVVTVINWWTLGPQNKWESKSKNYNSYYNNDNDYTNNSGIVKCLFVCLFFLGDAFNWTGYRLIYAVGRVDHAKFKCVDFYKVRAAKNQKTLQSALISPPFYILNRY